MFVQGSVMCMRNCETIDFHVTVVGDEMISVSTVMIYSWFVY